MFFLYYFYIHRQRLSAINKKKYPNRYRLNLMGEAGNKKVKVVNKFSKIEYSEPLGENSSLGHEFYKTNIETQNIFFIVKRGNWILWLRKCKYIISVLSARLRTIIMVIIFGNFARIYFRVDSPQIKENLIFELKDKMHTS